MIAPPRPQLYHLLNGGRWTKGLNWTEGLHTLNEFYTTQLHVPQFKPRVSCIYSRSVLAISRPRPNSLIPKTWWVRAGHQSHRSRWGNWFCSSDPLFVLLLLGFVACKIGNIVFSSFEIYITHDVTGHCAVPGSALIIRGWELYSHTLTEHIQHPRWGQWCTVC